MTDNDVDDFCPTWSPDCNQIAFNSNFDKSSEICIIDINGENLTRLTNNSIKNEEPVWSPDGSYLIFKIISKLNYKRQLFQFDKNGNSEIKLTDIAYSPNFSKDGNKIIFFKKEKSDFLDIFIMNDNGTNVKKLTNELYDQRFARASPSEEMILFTSLYEIIEDEYYFLTTMNFDGIRRQVLTPEHQDCFEGVWSADGQKIAYI